MSDLLGAISDHFEKEKHAKDLKFVNDKLDEVSSKFYIDSNLKKLAEIGTRRNVELFKWNDLSNCKILKSFFKSTGNTHWNTHKRIHNGLQMNYAENHDSDYDLTDGSRYFTQLLKNEPFECSVYANW